MLDKETADNVFRSSLCRPWSRTPTVTDDGRTAIVIHTDAKGGVFVLYMNGLELDYESSFHIGYEILFTINAQRWPFWTPDPKPESCSFRKHGLCVGLKEAERRRNK